MSAQFESAAPPPFDRAASEAFLQFLDPTAEQFTFQTFHDRQQGQEKRGGLAEILHESLSKNWLALCNYSSRGAGVYVAVNATDFRGRSNKNIVKVRALFADSDGAPPENLWRLRLAPHWTQQTGWFDPAHPQGPDNCVRWHAYYRVEGVSIDEFSSLQKRLAALFETDPSVCDPARVMRVPGFPNRKREPQSLIKRVSLPYLPPKEVYSREEFRRALEEAEGRLGGNVVGLPIKSRPGPSLKIVGAFPNRQPDTEPWTEGGEARLRSALAVFSAEDRDDRVIWFAVGAGLHVLEAADPKWRGREKWDDWSRPSDKFNKKDKQDKTWASFDRGYDGELIGPGRSTTWRRNGATSTRRSQVTKPRGREARAAMAKV